MRIQNWSRASALAVGVAVALSACTTLDPYTREEGPREGAAPGGHRSSGGRRRGPHHGR